MSANDPNGATTPQGYIEALEEPRRSQLLRLHDFIRTTVPELAPFMERPGLIGYGSYHYRYATGREGDSAIIGLSSRKNYISVYATGGDGHQYVAEMYKEHCRRPTSARAASGSSGSRTSTSMCSERS